MSTVGRAAGEQGATPRLALGLGAAAREIWTYRELLRQLVGRELKVKYKRSALGWVWSVANPLVIAGVFTLVFSFFAKVQAPIGDPSGLTTYALFVLSGLLVWNLTSNTASQGVGAIVSGSDLVRKVYFPRAILVLAHTFALLVAFVVELAVLLVLVLLAGARPGWALAAVPLLMVFQTCFAAGFGMLVAALNVFARDLQHLLSILLMIWFYATPVIYPLSLPPESTTVAGRAIPIRAILEANPMAMFVEAYRAVFYHGRFPSPQVLLALAVISVVVLIACFAVFRRLEPRFAEEV